MIRKEQIAKAVKTRPELAKAGAVEAGVIGPEVPVILQSLIGSIVEVFQKGGGNKRVQKTVLLHHHKTMQGTKRDITAGTELPAILPSAGLDEGVNI